MGAVLKTGGWKVLQFLRDHALELFLLLAVLDLQRQINRLKQNMANR